MGKSSSWYLKFLRIYDDWWIIKSYFLFIGRSVMVIMTCTPYSWFEKWSSSECQTMEEMNEQYESIKNVIGQKLIDQVVYFYPKIKVLYIQLYNLKTLNLIQYTCIRMPLTTRTWAHQLTMNFTSTRTKEQVLAWTTPANGSILFRCLFWDPRLELMV